MTHKPYKNSSGCADRTAHEAINNVMREAYPPSVVSFDAPIPPSVNHAYITTRQGRRVLTSDAKRWIEQAQLIAQMAKQNHGWRFHDGGKLVMELYAYWPDAKRRDIHNLHKLIADAFEGVLYRDDKMLLIRDMDFVIDRRRPRVEIVVREFDGD